MKITNITFFYCIAVMCALSFISCGNDDDTSGSGDVDCNSSLAVNNAISDEVEAVSIAIEDWAMDSSADNCNALKTAYQNYIDALISLQNCANEAGVGEGFAAAITLSEAGIEGLIC